MVSWLHRLRSGFRQLRWQLTLHYTLVTVGTLLVLALLLVGYIVSSVYLPGDMLQARYWTEVVDSVQDRVVPLVRHMLAQDPPDTAAMALLLDRLEGQTAEMVLLRAGSAELTVRSMSDITMWIVDAEGTVLARTGLPALAAAAERLDPGGIPGLEGPLTAALAGVTERSLLLSVGREERTVTVAAPVWSGPRPGSQVVGAVVLAFRAVPTQSEVPSHVLAAVGRGLWLLLLAAAILGATFGWLTARRLAARFGRLQRATEAWSKGDFGQSVGDNSGDELASLASALNAMADQLRVLLSRREEMAVSEERNRLARELHDSAKQQAFAASAQLGAALQRLDEQPREARAHVQEAAKLVDRVRSELTGLILQLRPTSPPPGGLPQALREYAMDWGQRNGIDVSVRVQGERELPSELEQALFRIAQEALANTARHSGAAKAELELHLDADGAVLAISDNGRGFDPSGPDAGVGLRSMQERAVQIGAGLAIESAPGEGTNIVVTLPDAGLEGTSATRSGP